MGHRDPYYKSLASAHLQVFAWLRSGAFMTRPQTGQLQLHSLTQSRIQLRWNTWPHWIVRTDQSLMTSWSELKMSLAQIWQMSSICGSPCAIVLASSTLLCLRAACQYDFERCIKISNIQNEMAYADKSSSSDFKNVMPMGMNVIETTIRSSSLP